MTEACACKPAHPPSVLPLLPPTKSYIAHYVLHVLPMLRSYNYVAKCDEGLTEWALVEQSL
jgi:hypothetical protein